MILRRTALLLALVAGGALAADDPMMGATPGADIEACKTQCKANFGEPCLANSLPDVCNTQREQCEADCDDDDGDDDDAEDDDD